MASKSDASSDQRVVIITGASGNLGRATARVFLASGARLVLVERSAGKLREAFPELAESAAALLLSGVNLTDPAAAAHMAAAALERFGRIDALVHTVGTWRGGRPVHETPPEEWSFLHDTNVRTTVLAARAVVPQMLAQGRGWIVTLGSRASLAGTAGGAAYAAAKSAVLRVTEALSAELKQSGINVNCVLLSTLDTPENRAAMPRADHGRWVPPAAAAEVIAFLASEAARAIHGAAIPVYGLA